MSSSDNHGSAIHPVGLPLLGAGCALWLYPLVSADIISIPLFILENSGAVILLVATVAATIAGMILDYITMSLENRLVSLSNSRKKPKGEQFATAFVIRWKLPQADQEFRRHEGLISTARVYLLHMILSTIAWSRYPIAGLAPWVVPVSSGVAAFVFALLWRYHKGRLYLLVKFAGAHSKNLKF